MAARHRWRKTHICTTRRSPSLCRSLRILSWLYHPSVLVRTPAVRRGRGEESSPSWLPHLVLSLAVGLVRLTARSSEAWHTLSRSDICTCCSGRPWIVNCTKMCSPRRWHHPSQMKSKPWVAAAGMAVAAIGVACSGRMLCICTKRSGRPACTTGCTESLWYRRACHCCMPPQQPLAARTCEERVEACNGACSGILERRSSGSEWTRLLAFDEIGLGSWLPVAGLGGQ